MASTEAFFSRRILVVDDNEDSADVLSEMLNMLGHQSVVANDGLTALALAANFKPEVVLLDLRLPTMDGYSVAIAMRKHPDLKEAFIVACTGMSQTYTHTKELDAGFDLHVTKPADIETLKGILLLRRTQPELGEFKW